MEVPRLRSGQPGYVGIALISTEGLRPHGETGQSEPLLLVGIALISTEGLRRARAEHHLLQLRHESELP